MPHNHRKQFGPSGPDAHVVRAAVAGRYGAIMRILPVVLAILVSSPTIACVGMVRSTGELLQLADVAFTAVAMDTRGYVWVEERGAFTPETTTTKGGASPIISALKVTEIFKDSYDYHDPLEIDKVVYLMQNGGSCSLSIATNEEYLIFGDRVLRNAVTRGHGSIPKEDAAETLIELREAQNGSIESGAP